MLDLRFGGNIKMMPKSGESIKLYLQDMVFILYLFLIETDV